MSPRRSLDFQRAVFVAWSTLLSSREERLSGNLICSAEDERESCLDPFDGRYIGSLVGPSRIIKRIIFPP
jgi:hypothetical protein